MIPYIEISINSKMLYITHPSTKVILSGHNKLVSFVMLSVHAGSIIGVSFHDRCT